MGMKETRASSLPPSAEHHLHKADLDFIYGVVATGWLAVAHTLSAATRARAPVRAEWRVSPGTDARQERIEVVLDDSVKLWASATARSSDKPRCMA